MPTDPSDVSGAWIWPDSKCSCAGMIVFVIVKKCNNWPNGAFLCVWHNLKNPCFLDLILLFFSMKHLKITAAEGMCTFLSKFLAGCAPEMQGHVFKARNTSELWKHFLDAVLCSLTVVFWGNFLSWIQNVLMKSYIVIWCFLVWRLGLVFLGHNTFKFWYKTAHFWSSENSSN